MRRSRRRKRTYVLPEAGEPARSRRDARSRESSRARGPGPAEGGRQPSEEELRAQIEEQLRTVRVQDLLLESVVSVINLSARRIAKEDERDLEQARVGIEAVRAVVDLLDDEPAKQVRSALSEVQMLYAKHAGEAARPSPRAAARAPAGPAAKRRRRSAGRAQRGPLEALDAARERPPPRLDSARFAGPDVPRPPPATRSATGGPDLTDFLTDYGVVIALVCAGAAVVYGALVTQRLLGSLARQRAHAEISRRRAGGRAGIPDAASTRSSPGSRSCSRCCSRSSATSTPRSAS